MAYYGGDAADSPFNDVNFTLYGGDGTDSIGKSNASFQAYGGNGNDTLYQSGDFYLDAWGGYGKDWISISGSTNSSFLYGEEEDDVINASGGFDYIEGGQGSDALYGGNGGDTIYGGDGDDINSISVTAGTGQAFYTTTQLAGCWIVLNCENAPVQEHCCI